MQTLFKLLETFKSMYMRASVCVCVFLFISLHASHLATFFCLSPRGHPSARERAHSGHGVSAAHPSLLVLRYGRRRCCSGAGLRRAGPCAPLSPVPLCGQEEWSLHHLQNLPLYQRGSSRCGAHLNNKTRARSQFALLKVEQEHKNRNKNKQKTKTSNMLPQFCTFLLIQHICEL